MKSFDLHPSTELNFASIIFSLNLFISMIGTSLPILLSTTPQFKDKQRSFCSSRSPLHISFNKDFTQNTPRVGNPSQKNGNDAPWPGGFLQQLDTNHHSLTNPLTTMLKQLLSEQALGNKLGSTQITSSIFVRNRNYVVFIEDFYDGG